MLSSSASQLRVPLSCLQLPPLSALSTAPLAINSDQRVRSPTRRHASSTATTLTRWPKAQFPLVQFPAWGWGFTRSASSDATSTAAMDSTTQASPPPPAQLNWNDYLSLRRSRRRYNLVSSIATSICTTAAGMTAVQQNVEQINSLVGLDSITTLAISTLASAGVGWLSGPVLGTAVFNLTHKSVRGEMAAVSTLPRTREK